MITRILLVLSLIFNQAWALPVLKNRDNLFQGANAFTNFATNSDFDLAASLNASVQTGTGSISLNTTSKLKGKNSLLLTPNTGSNVFRFTTTMNDTTNANYLTGQTCEASFSVVGTSLTTGYTAYVTQGSTQVSQSYSFTASATPSVVQNILFPCGDLASATYLDIAVTGTANAIYVDDIYVGLARNIGSVDYVGPWVSFTPTGSWVSNTTYTGRYRQVGDVYEFTVQVATSGAPTSASLTITLPITIDTAKIAGTADVQVTTLGFGYATDFGSRTYGVSVAYNSTTSVALRNTEPGTGGNAVNESTPFTFGAGDFVFANFKVPVSGVNISQVITQAAQGWYVAANISGANPSLGTVDVADYTEITNASLTMTPATNSQPVGIMCSSTNAAAAPTTSTSTCSAGSESLGANFSIPAVGWYEACIQYSHYTSVGAGGALGVGFQVVETPTNAQTISQQGKARVNNYISTANTDQDLPYNLCGVFYFGSVGIKGIRLMYEQDANGTVSVSQISMDGAAAVGQRDMLITVKPVTNGMPSPFVVGSVQSNSTGVQRIERATIALAASPTISNTSSDWISANTRYGTGDNSFTFSPAFSATPTCHCTAFTSDADTNIYTCNPSISSPSSTFIRIKTKQISTTPVVSNFDATVSLTCMGPK